MSTTINPDFFPDETTLKELANQFFNAVPGGDTKQATSFQPGSALPGATGFPAQFNPEGDQQLYNQPQSYLAANNFQPPSAGGIGISPSSVTNAANYKGGYDQVAIPVNQPVPDKGHTSFGSIGVSPLSLTNAEHFKIDYGPLNQSLADKRPASFEGIGVSPLSLTNAEHFKIGHSPLDQSLMDKVPKSFGGIGISPLSITNVESFTPGYDQAIHSIHQPVSDKDLPSVSQSDLSTSVSTNAVNNTVGYDRDNIPGNHYVVDKSQQSVAGSGISPSAVDNVNAFNADDPQTSLPDPHFADGKIPQSVAGSGRQPSLQQNQKADQQPYSPDSSFETDLYKALASYNTFIPASQLPVPGLTEIPYYFLQDKAIAEKSAPSVKGARKQTSLGHKSLQAPPFDANLIKKDFPILQEKVNGRPLIWLDNAATTQKPKHVIDRVSYFYEHENSNVHRAAHELAARATDAYEGAREKVRRFLNAKSPNEIVFVRGATEAINLVAKSWGEQYLNAGDEIILTHLEHHANIVPWQQLAAKKDLKIKVVPVDDDGQILLNEYAKLLGPKTKLVSFTQVSNALGTITPALQIAAMAHAAGAKVLVDGAQSVSHMRVDVQSLGADWFVFSGHKIFAPTGIGVLYGREELLNATRPWQGGGNMIRDVTFEDTKYHNAPVRFEAGTGNIADAVGLGAAIDYVTHIGIDLIGMYEHYLLEYGTARLKEIPGLRLIGTAPEKASVMSFVLDGYSNDEVGQALNSEGIAVRTGHHCAQPILRRFGVESTVRPSLAFYNSCADIDALIAALLHLRSKGKK